MREIALHIMDIAENGINAGADCIQVRVIESRTDNRLEVRINDNGSGIPKDMIDNVTDPFVSTRKTRRIGLGLSLLKAAALRCNGSFSVKSQPGQGTSVHVTFQYDHIDRAPLGNMASTIAALIAGNHHVDFVYRHAVDGEAFQLDTRQVKQELDDVPITDPAVIQYLDKSIRNALAGLEPNEVKRSIT